MIRGPAEPPGHYNRPLQDGGGRGQGRRARRTPTALRLPLASARVGTYRLVYHLNLPRTPSSSILPRVRGMQPAATLSSTPFSNPLLHPLSPARVHRVIIKYLSRGGSCYGAIRSDLREHLVVAVLSELNRTRL